ncbi:MAG: aminotransferase class V-fold PLP-dependent enzyme [Henriciella sp.]|nr:aminotransferase class V-fold PLP-dependent enzyme [Henriciella sp.]
MPESSYPKSLDDAIAFDAADPLSEARAAFSIPDNLTYLVGHSLGPVTHNALKALERAAQADWRNDLVGSWNTANWIDLPTLLGAPIAKLIGVNADEVVVCDSVSINLFKLVGAIARAYGSEARIIVEQCEFPTDQYILERLSEQMRLDFVRAPAQTGFENLQRGDIFVRSLVDYRTAEVADVVEMEALAAQAGAVVVWDLSHASGILNLQLADWGAKFAVGCTYKYLNGGPGAPAFIYVSADHVDELETPLAGWLGHAEPFGFSDHYVAAPGVTRFVAGTPPILSMTALKGALDVFDQLSLADIEAKVQRLGDMCLATFAALGLRSNSPPIGIRRGGHVSLIHTDGYAFSQALAKAGFKTDFRTPDTVRFGLCPLYLSYSDVWRAMQTLSAILESEIYLQPEYAVRAKVT